MILLPISTWMILPPKLPGSPTLAALLIVTSSLTPLLPQLKNYNKLATNSGTASRNLLLHPILQKCP
jgi:hypothetical protein